jgi:hypothetical protein
LQLSFQRNSDELWLAHQALDVDTRKTVTRVGAGPVWSRWILEGENTGIQLSPAFPDRPVIVKSEFSFKLLHAAQARVYVQIPLWVRIELIEKMQIPLAEIPTVILSNTWFGTPEAGELCYWLSSPAGRTIASQPSQPFLVTCPIQIINESDDELMVEKLALRVERLTLFESQGQFWSDLFRVAYQGKNDISRIEVSGKAPPEASQARPIVAPRSNDKSGFTAKTFENLIDLAGLDWFRRTE